MTAQIIQLALNALPAGCIDAVVALSVEIASEFDRRRQFCRRATGTAGALIGLSAVAFTKANFLPAYLLVLLGMSLIGIVFLIFVYLPLRRQSVLTIVIGTVGIGIFIQNVMLLTSGPLPERALADGGRGAGSSATSACRCTLPTSSPSPPFSSWRCTCCSTDLPSAGSSGPWRRIRGRDADGHPA